MTQDQGRKVLMDHLRAPRPEKDHDKVRENRLRATARRQGLVLVRSRRRDPRAVDFGTYMLLHQDGSMAAWGLPTGYGLTLDEIETALLGDGS